MQGMQWSNDLNSLTETIADGHSMSYAAHEDESILTTNARIA